MFFPSDSRSQEQGCIVLGAVASTGQRIPSRWAPGPGESCR